MKAMPDQKIENKELTVGAEGPHPLPNDLIPWLGIILAKFDEGYQTSVTLLTALRTEWPIGQWSLRMIHLTLALILFANALVNAPSKA